MYNDINEPKQGLTESAAFKANAPSTKKLWKTATKLGAVLIAYFVLYYLLSFLFNKVAAPLIYANIAAQYQSAVSEAIINIVLFMIILPCVFLLARIKTDLPLFKSPELPKKQIAKIIIIAMSGSYIAAYISSFIVSIIESFGVKMHSISPGVEMSPVGILVFAVPVLLFAPVFEELFFRGGVMSNLKLFGGWFACISCGAIFGMAHMNYPQILMAATLGSFSAFLLLKTKSIYPSMILHFSINLVACIANILLAVVSGGDVSPEAILKNISQGDFLKVAAMLLTSLISIGMFVIIILGIIFFVKEQKRNHDFWCFKETPAISTTNKLFAFITSPTVIIYFILTLTVTIANALMG